MAQTKGRHNSKCACIWVLHVYLLSIHHLLIYKLWVGIKLLNVAGKDKKKYGYLNLAITTQNIKHRLRLYILMKRTNDYNIYER